MAREAEPWVETQREGMSTMSMNSLPQYVMLTGSMSNDMMSLNSEGRGTGGSEALRDFDEDESCLDRSRSSLASRCSAEAGDRDAIAAAEVSRAQGLSEGAGEMEP